jgi:glycosyltransferase involved in cell wall biosynthesis
MPSRGEGFGFVLLEAMACGVPTVASRLDGGREAVRDGMLGVLVDPCDLEDVKRGIREALRRGRGEPPSGLDFFSFDNFASRARRLVHEAARSPRLRRWAA